MRGTKYRKHRGEKGDKSFHSKEAWELLCRMYNYTCPCCGQSEPAIVLTRDHIIPVSHGGTNWIRNIQPLCEECNVAKGSQTIYYLPPI